MKLTAEERAAKVKGEAQAWQGLVETFNELHRQVLTACALAGRAGAGAKTIDRLLALGRKLDTARCRLRRVAEKRGLVAIERRLDQSPMSPDARPTGDPAADYLVRTVQLAGLLAQGVPFKKAQLETGVTSFSFKNFLADLRKKAGFE